METTTFVSYSPEETFEIGVRIGRTVLPGAVVGLHGALGSGKTVIAKGIGKAIGVREEITSPTFTLVSEYRGETNLYHVDLYRIRSTEELDDLGLHELIEADGITVIEWAEKAEGLLPENAMRVDIFVGEECRRNVHVSGWKQG